MTVQFHPAVTYETFVSGISPDVSAAGLHFAVKPGWLLDAVQAARETDGDYLLVIDEINRADLAKVLGEAVYLLEASEIAAGRARAVDLPFKPDGCSGLLQIRDNLYILGTMNSADCSTASSTWPCGGALPSLTFGRTWVSSRSRGGAWRPKPSPACGTSLRSSPRAMRSS